jgi:hypothetical protein
MGACVRLSAHVRLCAHAPACVCMRMRACVWGCACVLRVRLSVFACIVPRVCRSTHRHGVTETQIRTHLDVPLLLQPPQQPRQQLRVLRRDRMQPCASGCSLILCKESSLLFAPVGIGVSAAIGAIRARRRPLLTAAECLLAAARVFGAPVAGPMRLSAGGGSAHTVRRGRVARMARHFL